MYAINWSLFETIEYELIILIVILPSSAILILNILKRWVIAYTICSRNSFLPKAHLRRTFETDLLNVWLR